MWSALNAISIFNKQIFDFHLSQIRRMLNDLKCVYFISTILDQLSNFGRPFLADQKLQTT